MNITTDKPSVWGILSLSALIISGCGSTPDKSDSENAPLLIPAPTPKVTAGDNPQSGIAVPNRLV